jgi:hypothetical protein
MLSAASFESRGSLLARASLVSPVRSRHLEAAFRSPITTAPRGRYGVFVPDLLLQRLAGFSSGPFGPRLLAGAGLPWHWRSQHRLPVALIRVPRSRSRLISASPSGLSSPSDHCGLRFAAGKLAFQSGPISLGSPHSVRLLRLVASGSRLLQRLAVPQISWNHLNSPPGRDCKSIGF